MLALVENRTPPRDLPADSELKQVEGSLQELRVVQLGSGDRLLCRDSAVYVSKTARSNILKTRRVYWPDMRKQIHELYSSCVECSLHKISKSRPANECSQSDLFQNFFPNSFLQADYFEFQGGDYMTVVCTLTGYGRVFICKGKTTEEALRVIRQWVALYGRCLEIRTDSGPAFRSNFQVGA